MKRNKRPPKELAKYAIYVKDVIGKGEGLKETFVYGQTQKEVKERAARIKGRKYLFKCLYDFVGEI